jgi:hypoxia up-regulated 1
MRRPGLNLAVLVTLALFVGHAGAAIMAIDLGSEFLKISILKPGKIPISIVNNEISKRKSAAAVAFVNGDRLLADEAAALAVRFPDTVFFRLRDLLGRRYDDPAVARMISESRFPYTVVQAPNRTTAAVQVGTGKDAQIYTAEEMVASLLEYAKRLANDAADGSPVTECVLVVPAFWSPAQRQALLDSAELAGLNVMALVHTHAAAALQYGIERDFTNKTEDVLFYDLGGGGAEAALVRFSSFQAADAPAGSPATSQFEVKDVAWVEHGVGCDALEATLINHFAAQHQAGAEAVLANPRAVAKLRKQVKRTKEVLSANSEAHVIVEELLAGQDFRGKITREEFEELNSKVWTRAAAPVTEILKRNNITGESLSAVELLGGCSRVPRVKAALTETLGGRALDMHMDADEAVVLGAGLFAANLSTIFRLRKFGMTDKAPYTVTFKLEGADEQQNEQKESNNDPDTPRVLVPALRKIPTKRAIALHNVTVDSFSVSLQYDNSAGAVLPCCVRQEELGDFKVEGIQKVIAKHGHSGKVALHTVVDQSGVFSLDRADAALEIEEEIKIKVPDQSGNDTAGAAAEEKTEEKKDDSEKADGAAADGEKKDSEKEKKKESASPPMKEVTKMWKHTVRLPLNITGSLNMPGLTIEQFAASRKTLRMLRERDEAKRATAKARNDLESYIISTRAELDSSESLKAVSTEEQRQEIVSALMDAEDWLYGDGEAATTTELREKLRKIRKGADKIEHRAAEAASRSTAVKTVLDFADLALKATNSWSTIKPWLNETDVAEVTKSVTELKEWVEKSAAGQDKKDPHEDPIFTVAEVARKMDPVRKAFTRLNSKPKPIEKKPVVVEEVKKGGDDKNSTETEKTEKETEKAEKAEKAKETIPEKEAGNDGKEEGEGVEKKHDEL